MRCPRCNAAAAVVQARVHGRVCHRQQLVREGHPALVLVATRHILQQLPTACLLREGDQQQQRQDAVCRHVNLRRSPMSQQHLLLLLGAALS